MFFYSRYKRRLDGRKGKADTPWFTGCGNTLEPDADYLLRILFSDWLICPPFRYSYRTKDSVRILIFSKLLKSLSDKRDKRHINDHFDLKTLIIDFS